MSLLVQPAPEAARRIARGFLDDATSARERLRDESDDEALHDFRVALRRLRSTIRAYRPYLKDTLRRKLQRRLRRMARATNRGRDLEVSVAWLSKQLHERGERALRSGERRLAEWLMARMAEEQSAAGGELRDLVDAGWQRLRDRLAGSLAGYTVTVRLDEAPVPRRFALVAARLIADQADDLVERMGRARAMRIPEDAHAARIAGKRLRYLVEPVADLVDGRALVRRLRELQDTLGEMQDAQVIEAGVEHTIRQHGPVPADARPGIPLLDARLRAWGAAAMEAALGAWDQDAADQLAAGVAALTALLRSAPLDGLEIERKLLLRALPPEALAVTPSLIEQGYLPGTRVVERLRREVTDGAVRHLRTVKDGRGAVRMELEEAISPALFAALWPLTQGRRVAKERFRIRDGELLWEIDRFTDRELVLAEVELAEPEAVAPLPAWLVPFVERDVTGEDAFVNATLAR